MRFPKPVSAQSSSRGVDHSWVEAGHVVLDFVETMADLITQTEIQGEIGANLPIILDEHLWLLQTCAGFRGDRSVPLIGSAQQEICIFFTSRRAVGGTDQYSLSVGLKGPLLRIHA